MINVSQKYKESCEKSTRKSYVTVKYGLYDKEAKTKISDVKSENQSFSNTNKTFNEVKTTNYNYISCEPNRVVLNDKFYFINDKTQNNDSENIAFWSLEMSNENCTFENNPTITYYFNKDIEFTDITLYFQEVCEEFNVYYYHNESIIVIRNVKGNEKLTISTSNESALSEVYFNQIKIEFVKTLKPFRYIKLNEIDFGIIKQFSKDKILEYDIIDEMSIDSSELSSNSLNFVLKDENGEYDILNPNNKLSTLQEKQELTFYHYLENENKFSELPLGTFKIKKFDVERNNLKITAYDDIYFMEDIYYGSKFYNQEEITKVLQDLFNYFNYTNYIIDDELKGIKITGYIPRVKFREAIRIIVEAGCCVVSKTRYGKTYIYKTYDEIVKTFKRKDIFEENPIQNLFNDVIDIVEYSYNDIVEDEEIVNIELEKGTHTILYEKYPIVENSLIKSEENANYQIVNIYATSCVVEVIEDTKVILKANYIKQSNNVKTFGKTTNSKKKSNTIKVNNNLITKNNSSVVANWKLSKKEIKYNFNTLSMPYIEVGDTCKYTTKYGNENEFIVTRIEFSNSIIQVVEGE